MAFGWPTYDCHVQLADGVLAGNRHRSVVAGAHEHRRRYQQQKDEFTVDAAVLQMRMKQKCAQLTVALYLGMFIAYTRYNALIGVQPHWGYLRRAST